MSLQNNIFDSNSKNTAFFKYDTPKNAVLLPKYVNVYYSDTVSKILLQTATNHYIKRLLQKSFRKLKFKWVNKKHYQRQSLRASVHYKYALKRNIFFEWQYKVIRGKEKTLTYKIIDLHHRKKVLSKYWMRWKYSRQFNSEMEKLTDVKYKMIASLFFHINAAEMVSRYYTSMVDYHAVIMGHENFKKRVLSGYFIRLQLYKERAVVKKNNKAVCKLFLKLKYKPEYLQKYFEVWQNFTQICVIKKLKCKIAEKHSNNKMVARCFKKLNDYKHQRIIKTTNKELAVGFYYKILLFKSVHLWINFANKEIRLKNLLITVENNFNVKLMQKCLQKLQKYKNHQLFLKMQLLEINAKVIFKMKQKYFIKFKKYYALRLLTVLKTSNALHFYKQQIIRKYFKKLQKYAMLRKVNLMKRQQILYIADSQRRLRTLQTSFIHWNLYKLNREEKVLKISFAQAVYQNSIYKRAVLAWKSFTMRKKLNARRCIILSARFELTEKCRCFRKLKKYAEEELKLRKQLEKALELHTKSLLLDGIRSILIMASEKQKANQLLTVKNLERKYAISLKFFKIWKYKALRNTDTKSKVTEDSLVFSLENQENLDINFDGRFQWNPISFVPPRIPACFNNFSHRFTNFYE